PDGLGLVAATAVALGVLYAVVSYLGAIAVEVIARKNAASKLGTLTSLFSRGASKQASGLSFLRGAAIGLVLLAADTFAIWIGTMYFRARLSPVHIGLLGAVLSTVASPVGLVVAIVAAQAVGIGLLVAFADSIAARLS